MADFTGNEGRTMDITTAAGLTSTFRTNYSSQSKAFFFGKNNINNILGQTGCMGIRIYFGEDGSGNLVLILVGATAKNDDQTSGYIYDYGVPCPTFCGANNSLNS